MPTPAPHPQQHQTAQLPRDNFDRPPHHWIELLHAAILTQQTGPAIGGIRGKPGKLGRRIPKSKEYQEGRFIDKRTNSSCSLRCRELWSAETCPHLYLQKCARDKLGDASVSHFAGRARTRRVQRDLAGGARTPGTVKSTEHRAAMPPASEICITRLKEPNQFVRTFADGWHAFQGAVE